MGVTLDLLKKLGLDENHDGIIDADDLKLITRAEVEEIYFKVAWDAVGADNLPPGIDIEAADIAFNSFPRKFFQFVREGRTKTIEDITRRRKEFYNYRAQTNPDQEQFLRGWLNRADAARALALKLQNEQGGAA